MKKQIKSTLAIMLTAIILGGSQFVASAQTADSLSVHVPFDFVVADRQMPAGRYTVQRVNVHSEAILRIQREDGRAGATVLTKTERGAAQGATLTFRQYGDRYFLAGIWLPGAVGGRKLRESKQERTLRAEARAEPRNIALSECE